MSRFVEESIRRAGLHSVLASRRAGDLATVRATIGSWKDADLLALGAVADAVRVDDVGEVVHIHEHAGKEKDEEATVTWVEAAAGASELDFLRAVAVARIVAPTGARIGVDWSQRGLELAQVALGFGASDMRGVIMRKSGLPILADERLKVKGQGMVELRAIKKREVAALVTHAGRLPLFRDDGAPRARESSEEVARV